jgi:hypothetical protein
VCNDVNECGPEDEPRATWIRHNTALDSFDPGSNDGDVFGYGPGIGLIDVNQDGLLDVALGRVLEESVTGLCVYLNHSEAGEMRFEPDEVLCDGSLPAEAVHVVDLNGNGDDELLLSSRGRLLWNEPASNDQFVDLFSELDESDPRKRCLAGTSLVVDIDADGYLDVLLGCQLIFPTSADEITPSTTPNLVLSGSASGPVWTYSVEEVASAGLDDPGFTLAFGAFVQAETGLWSIVDANDTFSVRGRRNTDFSPGRRYTMRSPALWGDTSGLPEFEIGPIVQDESNWASFMGVSRIWTTAGDVLTLLSDWGPIRALKPEESEASGWVDVASSVGLEMEALNGFQLYSWTMVVDDYDADGRDDVFVVHGMVPDSNVQSHASHRHVQAFQSAEGTFELEFEGFGVSLPEERPTTRHPVPPAGRSALRWDADLDGRLDLIINYHLGPPELYTLSEAATRCTLRPRPSTVNAMNAGYAHDRGDGVWRSWDNGGQHRASPPSTITVPADTVRFRFPSGASIPIRCTDGPYQVITEPDWLRRVPDSDVVVIDAQLADMEPLLSVRALWRNQTEQGLVELTPTDDRTRWLLPDLPDASEIMVELNGRWILRWLP